MPRKKKSSKQPPNPDPSSTGQPTQKKKRFLIRKASPDSPIFQLGYVIGGRYSKRTPAKKPTDGGSKG